MEKLFALLSIPLYQPPSGKESLLNTLLKIKARSWSTLGTSESAFSLKIIQNKGSREGLGRKLLQKDPHV